MASAVAPAMRGKETHRRLGIAWIMLCIGLAFHVADEALTGFLSVYNPTAAEIGRRTGFHPPQFGFTEWLFGLSAGVVILLALSPFAFRNSAPWRPLAYVFAAIMLMNGISHTVGTILGHSFADIRFARPMPGFYSAPLIFLCALNLFLHLRRTRR